MPGTDIYNAVPTFGGAFSMDEATLTFAVGGSDSAEDGGLGYLIQSVSGSYTRPVQRIFELGPNKTTYYVIGRPEGRLQINRLAAPAPVNTKFLSRFANVCNVADNTLTITANPAVTCAKGIMNIERNTDGTLKNQAFLSGQLVKPSRYTFRFCLIDALAFQTSVQGLALNENMSLIFASMEIEDGTTSAIGANR